MATVGKGGWEEGWSQCVEGPKGHVKGYDFSFGGNHFYRIWGCKIQVENSVSEHEF